MPDASTPTLTGFAQDDGAAVTPPTGAAPVSPDETVGHVTSVGPAARATVAAPTDLVIEPRSGWIPVDFGELWRFRELMFFLVWRDVKVRYKQTVLGVAWAVLVPIFSVTIFTVIFGNFAGLKKTLPPDLVQAYPVYVYAGLLPWLFFSNAVSLGGMSLVNQQQLLTKIYFPRLFVPSATVTGSLVDMGLSFCVFAAMMAIYGVAPSPLIVLLPCLVLLVWAASLGIAYLLSALTVSYRDFRFVIPFMVQAWQFLSPVVYPTSIIPERYRLLYALNPLAGIIEGFRGVIFGTPIPWGMLAVSTLSSLFLLVFGMLYFRKTERRFADIA
ncbi:Teichoic acid translocation permease protein TagG [Pirellulimonas nuda]|uniref:Transport permease protein n=1 Tax=Pirellulimonas nuda TaxID=2528009 RepID=A0A518DCX1_9BACT|nr:ABC transporter permease [Pirellulimonas nuda]QDU89332.1 Teichoic acid translocation permease protein TagG [Pirellulimonas nuda]